ncbi:MAG TPA: fibronectin type III domain-containing protein, partial [Paludibacteraceae bacterium]|nr:fibronectin type III domain-containing protein [Paludibacteraceae bacterium]
MKKYIKIYFVLLILPFLIASCLNKEEFNVNPNLQSVSNLQSALVGDSVKLTWTLPASTTPLKVMISSDTQTFVQLPANSTSVTWGIVEVNKPYVLTIKVADDNGNTSLGQSVSFTREGTNPVENLDAKRNPTDIVVTWTLPQQNTATSIELTYDNQVVNLPITATSYRILNVISDKKYVIKVRTKSATLTSHYVTKVVNSLNFAFLTTFETLTALQANGDDDEIAAANWFVA